MKRSATKPALLQTLAMALLILLALAQRAGALLADTAQREYAVKAAFIYNFAQFVEWPREAFDSEGAPLVIGLLGDTPLATALERAIQGKAVGTHPLVVRRFAAVSEVGNCHILYTNAAADDDYALKALFEHLGSQPVLTVGESGAFLAAGGMLRFYTEEAKVHFEVNVDAARAARLKISSKLLKLARIFRGDR